jgi:hypothetical protein
MPPLTGTSSRTTPWTASVSPDCSPSSTSTPWSRALQIKEKATAGEGDEDVVVTALTVGPDEASDAIKKALQMGADKGVHVVDDDRRLGLPGHLAGRPHTRLSVPDR